MILTTERLLLREFTENDWHIVFAYQSDPRYLRYAPWTHRLREKVERLVQDFVEALADDARQHVARAAGRKGDQQRDRPVRIAALLGVRGRECEQQRGGQDRQMYRKSFQHIALQDVFAAAAAS